MITFKREVTKAGMNQEDDYYLIKERNSCSNIHLANPQRDPHPNFHKQKLRHLIGQTYIRRQLHQVSVNWGKDHCHFWYQENPLVLKNFNNEDVF
jgi:hypothetical protein